MICSKQCWGFGAEITKVAQMDRICLQSRISTKVSFLLIVRERMFTYSVFSRSSFRVNCPRSHFDSYSTVTLRSCHLNPQALRPHRPEPHALIPRMDRSFVCHFTDEMYSYISRCLEHFRWQGLINLFPNPPQYAADIPLPGTSSTIAHTNE